MPFHQSSTWSHSRSNCPTRSGLKSFQLWTTELSRPANESTRHFELLFAMLPLTRPFSAVAQSTIPTLPSSWPTSSSIPLSKECAQFSIIMLLLSSIISCVKYACIYFDYYRMYCSLLLTSVLSPRRWHKRSTGRERHCYALHVKVHPACCKVPANHEPSVYIMHSNPKTHSGSLV